MFPYKDEEGYKNHDFYKSIEEVNYTKCSNINLAEHNIKFVALAQSKRQFAREAGITYYGKVIDIKVVKRNTIKDIPSDSEEDYYVFKIEGWDKL